MNKYSAWPFIIIYTVQKFCQWSDGERNQTTDVARSESDGLWLHHGDVLHHGDADPESGRATLSLLNRPPPAAFGLPATGWQMANILQQCTGPRGERACCGRYLGRWPAVSRSACWTSAARSGSADEVSLSFWFSYCQHVFFINQTRLVLASTMSVSCLFTPGMAMLVSSMVQFPAKWRSALCPSFPPPVNLSKS